jgi:hypothetical protein
MREGQQGGDRVDRAVRRGARDRPAHHGGALADAAAATLVARPGADQRPDRADQPGVRSRLRGLERPERRPPRRFGRLADDAAPARRHRPRLLSRLARERGSGAVRGWRHGAARARPQVHRAVRGDGGRPVDAVAGVGPRAAVLLRRRRRRLRQGPPHAAPRRPGGAGPRDHSPERLLPALRDRRRSRPLPVPQPGLVPAGRRRLRLGQPRPRHRSRASCSRAQKQSSRPTSAVRVCGSAWAAASNSPERH